MAVKGSRQNFSITCANNGIIFITLSLQLKKQKFQKQLLGLTRTNNALFPPRTREDSERACPQNVLVSGYYELRARRLFSPKMCLTSHPDLF